MADRYLLESGAPDGYLLEDGSGVLLLDAVAAGAYRAFRINITANNWFTAGGFAEFGPATSAGGANAAISVATATALRTNGSFVPANVIDGDSATFWDDNGSLPTWLLLDFGASAANWVLPVEFLLTARSNGDLAPTSFTIEATQDDPAGSPTWTTLITRSGDAPFTAGETKRYAVAASYSLTCVTGTFTLSGQATALPVAMSASRGVFTLTGNPVTPTHGYSLVATRGTFTLVGSAAGLIAAHKLTAVTGAFTLTGQAMVPAAKMLASTGAFVLTGYSASLPVTTPLATGSFVLNGQAATLKAARLLTAVTGAFILNSSTTLLPVTMPAARGVFSLTGNAATLRATMPAATGVFVLAGNAAGINKVGSSTLVADRSAFVLTGYASGALHAARLSAVRGAFTLSGQSAVLRAAHLLSAAPGAFVLIGNPSSPLHQAQAAIASASFHLTGFPVGAVKQSRLAADTGVFVVSGLAARIVSVVLPTPESRSVAGVLVDRFAEGSVSSRTAVGNLQPRNAAA